MAMLILHRLRYDLLRDLIILLSHFLWERASHKLRTDDLAFKPQHERVLSTKTKQEKYKALNGLHDIEIDSFSQHLSIKA